MDRLPILGLDGGMTTNTTSISSTTTPLTLVVGGTGKTGRRVADRLLAAGHPVRIGSRSAPTPFFWEDPSTWEATLGGVQRAYVSYYPDIAFPGAKERVAEFAGLARRAGVERLVLLSGRGEPEAQAAEELLLGSGVDVAVVRCSFFAQNFSEHFLLGPVLDGAIALPAGEVAEPIVDADDIADVAVAALTEPGHGGRVFELTGPRLLTFHDAAADLSAACGRTIRYIPVTPDEYVDAAVIAGLPVEEAGPLAEMFAYIFDGHNSSLATGVHDALGRPARDFRDYATTTASTGVWDVPATIRPGR
jgi:uncharacterized protein YbjT (DUF2867 family)